MSFHMVLGSLLGSIVMPFVVGHHGPYWRTVLAVFVISLGVNKLMLKLLTRF